MSENEDAQNTENDAPTEYPSTEEQPNQIENVNENGANVDLKDDNPSAEVEVGENSSNANTENGINQNTDETNESIIIENDNSNKPFEKSEVTNIISETSKSQYTKISANSAAILKEDKNNTSESEKSYKNDKSLAYSHRANSTTKSEASYTYSAQCSYTSLPFDPFRSFVIDTNIDDKKVQRLIRKPDLEFKGADEERFYTTFMTFSSMCTEVKSVILEFFPTEEIPNHEENFDSFIHLFYDDIHEMAVVPHLLHVKSQTKGLISEQIQRNIDVEESIPRPDPVLEKEKAEIHQQLEELANYKQEIIQDTYNINEENW